MATSNTPQKHTAKKSVTALKIALVHDYLREYGGAERVVEALHELFPEAPLYVAFKDEAALGIHWQKFKTWDIRESWLTKIPGYKRLYSPLRIWSANYFEAFDLSEYDLVISSSNAYMGKAVKVRPDAIHVCYCHTPARSLYGYSTMSNWQKHPFIKVVGTLINHYLRVVDFNVAQRVGYFIANSQETRQRIKKFYRRDATVMYPPVDVAEKVPKKGNGEYYLYVNRLAWAKHPELAVQVCSQMQLPLKVVGTGKLLSELQAMAGPTVEFLGSVSDEQLHQLYAGAKALLYPVEDEDFGIVPVEAMGHGVPVIAHSSGGPRETIIEEKTGLFIHELSVAALKEAIHLANSYNWSATTIHAHARKYSKSEFQSQIQKFITSLLS